MSNPAPQKAPYPLRMPDSLREKLEQAARESGRSLNAEIVTRLIGSMPGASDEEIRSYGLATEGIAAQVVQRMLVSDRFMEVLEELRRKTLEIAPELALLTKEQKDQVFAMTGEKKDQVRKDPKPIDPKKSSRRAPKKS